MPPNKPLQARAGQNAPFPWGPYAHTRGRLAEAVIVRGDGTDQVLMEGVCLPGIDPAGAFPVMGSALGLDAALTVAGGVVTLQDEDGDLWPPFSALTAVPAMLTPTPISGLPFSGFAGCFLVAEGEKIIMQGAVGGGTGKFYPNVGLIPNDPSELKAYRIDLSDGARHLIAQAPPGKALCQVPVAGGAGTPGINYFGIITRNDSAATAPTVQMYLDGIKVGGPQTLNPAGGGYLGATPIVLDPSGRLTLASGSKLEAEVTGLASGARVRWCSSMRMENGS